ncbi:secondary thiamine-phosphate synthase enzyme YjbQ [bacterium]|nr:secondary thiamine-phosphate synthase enzyme YjbQ [bacterium]
MIEIQIKTPKRSVIIDITDKIQNSIENQEFKDGLCYVFVPHTTAAVTINENADPAVKRDMTRILDKLIPFRTDYEHLEGNSDSHVKASLIGHSVSIIVENGRLLLGQWQGIQFCEFDGPGTRKILIKFF